MTSPASWTTLSVSSTMPTEKSSNTSSSPTARVSRSQRTLRRSMSGQQAQFSEPWIPVFIRLLCHSRPSRKEFRGTELDLYLQQTDCFPHSLLSHAPCRLYVNWRFLHGIEAQFLALQKGFNEVIPQHLLKSFDEKELEVGDKRRNI